MYVDSAVPVVPANLRCVGAIFDAEHVSAVDNLIDAIKNDRGRLVLQMWRRAIQKAPFCVLAGELHTANGGIVGGISRDWEGAKTLFQIACARHDDVAARHGDLTAMWLLAVSPERREELSAIVAMAQQTAGSA